MGRFEAELAGVDWPRSRAEILVSGVTPAMLRGRRWLRTSTGFYRDGRRSADGTSPAQRIVDAVPLVPPGGAIGGWAAAYVHGADWLDGIGRDGRSQRVPVILGTTVGRMPTDPRYFRGLLHDDEITVVHGIGVTSLERTAFDCARWSRTVGEATVCVDAMLRLTALTVPALAEAVPRYRGWRNVRRVRHALTLADGRVESPWETRLRVLYVLNGGAVQPQVNVAIRHRLTGALLGVADLLDVEAGLVIEFDGAYHRDRLQHHADNLREETFESVGLLVARVDSLDFASQSRLLDRLLAARARGLRRDRAADLWSISPDPMDRAA